MTACHSDAFCSCRHTFQEKTPRVILCRKSPFQTLPARNTSPNYQEQTYLPSWTCLKSDTMNTVIVYVQSCPDLTQWGEKIACHLHKTKNEISNFKKSFTYGSEGWDVEQEIETKEFGKDCLNSRISKLALSSVSDKWQSWRSEEGRR